MQMKQNYTEDELLEVAKSLQQIIYGNTSGVHYEDFKTIINYTESDRRTKLLDNISNIMDINDKFADPAEHEALLARVFGNGREYKTVRHALTFRIPSLKSIVEELKVIISEFEGLDITGTSISTIMGPYSIE